jgi:PAS domain-containing protein
MKQAAATKVEGKHADEVLATSERDVRSIADTSHQSALLHGLFASVPEAIVLLDTNDRILQVNPEFTRMFVTRRRKCAGV